MSIKSATWKSARTADIKPRASSSLSKFPSGVYTIHTPDKCRQILKNRPIHLKRCTYEGKEMRRAQEKEGFRTVLVPSTELTVYPKIITNSEFSQILKRTHKPTKEEQEAALELAEYEKARLMRECIARKEAIRRMDLIRNREKKGRTSDVEQERQQRGMDLLERAYEMQLDQEEQVKKCNKIILETKCRAVRDAQVAEKRLIEREGDAEERRMNELMEQERVNAIRAEAMKEKERLIRQRQFAECLMEQIQANEQERLLEYERKREESKLNNLKSIAEQEAQLEKMREKEMEHERAQRDLAECNERLKHFKAMEAEENRIMDTRIQKYQQEKSEREKKLKEAIRQEYLRKERGKDRIAEQTAHSLGLQAQIDEMNAIRIQEETEREWRRCEKERALMRAENMKNLRLGRDQQIANKINLQALEIERERQEFHEILTLQKEAMCREQKAHEKKHKQALLHRSEILKQVNEKEKQKIMHRQKMFEEGLAICAENELRKQRIRGAIERKYNQMIENNIPEVYIKQVKRNIDNIK